MFNYLTIHLNLAVEGCPYQPEIQNGHWLECSYEDNALCEALCKDDYDSGGIEFITCEMNKWKGEIVCTGNIFVLFQT